MASMRTVKLEDSGAYSSIKGNRDILKNHIKYFEERLQDEIKKPYCDYACSPNFVAWLRFYTEFITNWLYWRYFEFTGTDWDDISSSYYYYSQIKDALRNELKNCTREPELTEVLHKIKVIIELRNCFVHGGLPNILRPIGRNSGFGDVKKEEIEIIINPKNFNNTKEIFDSVHDNIKKCLKVPPIYITA